MTKFVKRTIWVRSDVAQPIKRARKKPTKKQRFNLPKFKIPKFSGFFSGYKSTYKI